MILKFALMFVLIGQPPPPTVEPGQSEQPKAQVTQPAETVQSQTGVAEGAQDTAVADTTLQPKQGGLPRWSTWVILLGVLVVFYLLMILPQRRRQKKHQEMLKSLNRGDKVVTNGGIHGVITRVKETTFIIRTGEKTTLEIDKSVVAQKK